MEPPFFLPGTPDTPAYPGLPPLDLGVVSSL